MVFTGILALASLGMGAATIGLYRSGQDQMVLAGAEFKLASAEFASTHRLKLVLREAYAPSRNNGESIRVGRRQFRGVPYLRNPPATVEL